MIYIAIIGDIIQSKALLNRAQVQDTLHQQLLSINQEYADSIASPFTITTGDEFQALLGPTSHIFQLIEQIQLAMKPVELRFGIGIGEMLTPINKVQSIGSDGPAFWRARQAINHIHDKNDYGASQIALVCDKPELQEMINSLLTTGDFIKSKWTKNQWAILEVLLGDKIYQESFEHQKIAAKLGINPSGFTKRLKASGLKQYLRSRKAANDMILSMTKNKKEEGRKVDEKP